MPLTQGARTSARSGASTTRVSLSKLLLSFEIGQRLPSVQDLQRELSAGAGTVMKVLRELENLGAVSVEARKTQGTIVLSRHVGKLWREADLGNLILVMPPPGPIEQMGIVQAVRDAVERTGVPVVTRFTGGAEERLRTVYHRHSHAAVCSLGAYNNLRDELPGMTHLDLGPASYYDTGTLVLVSQTGTLPEKPRIGIDHGSYDHEILTHQLFDHLEPAYVPCDFYRAPAMVLEGAIHSVVWHRMPTVIPPELAGLQLTPITSESSDNLVDSLSHGTIVTRAIDAPTNALLREVKVGNIRQRQAELRTLAEDGASRSVLWPG